MIKSKQWIINIYALLIAVIGVAVSGDLYSRFSASPESITLVLLALTLTFTLTLAALAAFILNFHRPEGMENAVRVISSSPWLGRLTWVFLLLFYEGFQDILFLYANLDPVLYGRFLLSKFSLLLGLTLVSGLSVVLLMILGWKEIIKNWGKAVKEPGFWIPLLILVSLFIWIAITGNGFRGPAPNQGYFQPLTAPLIGIQVLLVGLAFFGLIRGAEWLKKKIPAGSGRLEKDWLEKKIPAWSDRLESDWLILLVIWAAAFLLWMNVPLSSDYMIDVPRPPNFEVYLNSDAMYYEHQAQRLLVGEGLSPITEHPMYSLFLTGLHALDGDQYTGILPLQVAVLSLIPVFIYRLTALMGTRNAGGLAAVLYIILERNNLLLKSFITGPDVKTLMTELPALLALLCFMLFSLFWLRDPQRERLPALAAGGFLGLASLIRMELLVLTPVFLLAGTLILRKQVRKWGIAVAPFLVGLILILTPWVIRNWQVTGVQYIDKYYVIRARWQSFEDIFKPDEEGLQKAPVSPSQTGEDDDGNSWSRMSDDFFGDNFQNHFANSVSQLFLFLPSNHQPLLTVGSVINFPWETGGNLQGGVPYFSTAPYLKRYARSLPYWWYDWEGGLAPRSVLPLLISLSLVSAGVYLMGRDSSRQTGYLILVVFTYITVYAFFGSSGGRFMLLVNWIPLVFFSAGLEGLARRFRILEEGKERPGWIKGEWRVWSSQKPHALWLGTLILVFVAISLQMIEIVLPPRYTEETLDQVRENLLDRAQTSDQQGDRIQQILRGSQPLVYGKALFPRYFPAGEEMADDRQNTIPPSTFSRLEFYLVGMKNIWVVIPLEESLPLPQGSEVIIKGTWQDQVWEDGQLVSGWYLKADEVIVLGSGEEGAAPYLISAQGNE